MQDSLKIKKGLELVSRPHFSQEFLIKNFILQYYINWANFITRLCLLPKLFSKLCFVFHVWAFDDVMTFGYLKSSNLIMSRMKRPFEVKKNFFVFRKCCLLNEQNKLAKIWRTQPFKVCKVLLNYLDYSFTNVYQCHISFEKVCLSELIRISKSFSLHLLVLMML